MTLGLVIGTGPVGEYAVTHISQVDATCQIIGLRAARTFLSGQIPPSRFVTMIRFKRFIGLMKDLEITDVTFAGSAEKGSFGRVPDAMALRYFLQNISGWIPHAYCAALSQCLTDNGINIHYIFEYFKELRMIPGMILGGIQDYSPDVDFHYATEFLATLPTRRNFVVVESCIVDHGSVLMHEHDSTDELIERFASSEYRATAVRPVLCKVHNALTGKVITPTIGLRTAQLCREAGIVAIVVEADRSVLMQRNEVAVFAGQGYISVYAL